MNAPVLNSCAIVGDRIIVGTQAGRLFARSATDGAILWTYHGARKGYAAAPTVADGVIYIGAKGGRFHAVEALSGRARWVFQVGGPGEEDVTRTPILCTAAVLDSRVFFGAENMFAYALNREDGSKRWRRHLAGQSFLFGAEVGSNLDRGGVSISAG